MSGGVPVVATPAELDISTTDKLRVVLLEATSNGYSTVVVDMTRTRFCDCAVLTTLLRAYKRVLAEGSGLRLVIPADGVVPRIGAALGEAAASAGRTQTFLGAKRRRLCRHMPKKKAQAAVMRTQLTIAHRLLPARPPATANPAPATTSRKPEPAARPAATSAAWNASATRSPPSPSPAPAPEPAR